MVTAEGDTHHVGHGEPEGGLDGEGGGREREKGDWMGKGWEGEREGGLDEEGEGGREKRGREGEREGGGREREKGEDGRERRGREGEREGGGREREGGREEGRGGPVECGNDFEKCTKIESE